MKSAPCVPQGLGELDDLVPPAFELDEVSDGCLVQADLEASLPEMGPPLPVLKNGLKAECLQDLPELRRVPDLRFELLAHFERPGPLDRTLEGQPGPFPDGPQPEGFLLGEKASGAKIIERVLLEEPLHRDHAALGDELSLHLRGVLDPDFDLDLDHFFTSLNGARLFFPVQDESGKRP